MRDKFESPEVKRRPLLQEYLETQLQLMAPIPQTVIQIDLQKAFGPPVDVIDDNSSRPARYIFNCPNCHRPKLVWEESDYSGAVKCQTRNCTHGTKTLSMLGISEKDDEASQGLIDQITRDYMLEYGPIGIDGESESLFSGRDAGCPTGDIGVPENIKHAIWNAGAKPPLIQYKEFQKQVSSDVSISTREFKEALEQLSRLALVQELQTAYRELNLIKGIGTNAFYYRRDHIYHEWQEINEEKLFESLMARVYRYPTQTMRWSARALLKDQSKVLKELIIEDGHMDNSAPGADGAKPEGEIVIIPLSNGFVRVKLRDGKIEKVPFTRQGARVFDRPKEMRTWCFTYALNVDLDESRERSELWDKAVADWFPDLNLRREFTKMCFYILAGLQTEQKAFILYGRGGEGKTVIAGLLQELMGSRFVSNITYDDILASDFAVSDLHGKFLNVIGEVSLNKPIPSATFKMLVGHDKMSANVKHKARKVFVNKARLLVLTNHYLPTNDLTHGFFRRLMYFPVQRPKKADAKMSEKLKADKQSIFHSIVSDGAKYWHQDGGFKIAQAQLSCRHETYLGAAPVAEYLWSQWGPKDEKDQGNFEFDPAMKLAYVQWKDEKARGYIDPEEVHRDFLEYAVKRRYAGIPYSHFVTQLRLFVEFLFAENKQYTVDTVAHRFSESDRPRKAVVIQAVTE